MEKTKLDKLRKRIHKFINFEDKESIDDLDRMLDELLLGQRQEFLKDINALEKRIKYKVNDGFEIMNLIKQLLEVRNDT